MLHMHVTSWSLALILFIVAVVLQRGGKEKGARTTHNILRIVFLLTIATGVGLVSKYGFMQPTLIKGALAIILIGLMEMILVRGAKHKNTALLWVLWLAAAVGVFYYGYVVISGA